jgi:adenine C2-methylase RlmN of 23S rRNA A2503 and tRNA A37
MPSALAQPGPLQFFASDVSEFDRQVREWGWPAFRAGQVRDWVYTKLVSDPAQMSNLAKLDRQQLAEKVVRMAPMQKQ